MSTWTLEHAKLIVAAWLEVEIQALPGQWRRPAGGLTEYELAHLGDPSQFRLPPKKKIVEWTASDVKPGMAFRRNT